MLGSSPVTLSWYIISELSCLFYLSVDGARSSHQQWCPASPAMYRYSPGQVSACVHTPTPFPPSAFSPCLFCGLTVLMAGQHLFSLPEQRGGGKAGSPPHLPEESALGRKPGSHQSYSWSLGCCFYVGFSLPVRPGIFNDSENEAGSQM